MAYKFQLGRARLSGSVIVEEGLESDFATDISSSQDVLADQNIQAGRDVEAGRHVFGRNNVEAGDDVSAGRNVLAGGEFRGNLQYAASNGSGIQSFTFDNSGNATIALDDSHVEGLFSVVDTNSIDMHYDGAGAFSGSVRLKSEAGGTISVDSSGLFIANSAISNAKLQNSTISGKQLGTNLDSMSVAAGSALTMTSYNGSAAVSDLAVQVDGTSIAIASNRLEVVDSHVRGLISEDDTDTIDMHYDSSTGIFSGSVKLKSESGGTISKDASGIFIANSAIANAKLVNSTISGKALGTNLDSMSVAAGSALTMTSYNGSAAVSDLAVQVDGTSITIASNRLELVDSHAHGLFSVADTNSIDMSYNGSGQFSADLILSGAASNDALEVTADGLNLKSTIAGNRTFANDVLVQGDLQVDGALTYINTTNLEVTDRLIRLAKGDSTYVDGAGFEFEWGDSFQTAQVAFDSVAEDAFDSSLPIQAPHMKAATFHGELIGASRMDVVTKVDTDTLEAGKINLYANSVGASAAEAVVLPSGAALKIGQQIMFKAGAIADGGSIRIYGAAGVTIDDVTEIYLESEHAAVTLVYAQTDKWKVF